MGKLRGMLLETSTFLTNLISVGICRRSSAGAKTEISNQSLGERDSYSYLIKQKGFL